MFIPSTRHTEKVRLVGDPECDAHAAHNYDLCRAIDLLSLQVVLDKLVKEGKMHTNTAAIYKTQASALLAALLTENNRAHGY